MIQKRVKLRHCHRTTGHQCTQYQVRAMQSSSKFLQNVYIIVNFNSSHFFFRRDEYQGKRPRGGLRGRTNQLVPQESAEDYMRGSVERLDTQVLTLHQDVATLSYEVLYLVSKLLSS